MKRLFTAIILTIMTAAASADEERRLWLLSSYDEANDGLQGHYTQILQDHSGFIWIATWNGLNRFDGYEFRQMKPQAGDGCTMQTDRLRDIWLADKGDIYCKTDEGIYRFDIKTYKFRDLESDEERAQAEQMRLQGESRGHFNGHLVSYTDPQGLVWRLQGDVLSCLSDRQAPATRLEQQKEATIRCIARDSKGRIWLSTREDATLRLLTPDGQLIGYMTPTGQLSRSYTSFGQPVYSFLETADGHFWLGSKPGGLYRLSEHAESRFQVERVDGLPVPSVYSMAQDPQGRLWVATLGGGLACIEQPGADRPTVAAPLPSYPRERGLRVRYIHITPSGHLMAATTEGLVVARLNHNIGDMRFKLHTKDPKRPTSLGCNATMDIIEDQQQRIFVSTETGGICEITSESLDADSLTFRNYNQQNGLLPTDIATSMALDDGRLLIVSSMQLMLFDTYRQSTETFGHYFFQHAYRFGEPRPLKLDDGRWLLPTTEGALLLPESKMRKSDFQPPLVLTSIAIQNGDKDLAVDDLDTLRLRPSERSLTIQFAALDYVAPKAISYQFRIGDDSQSWNSIGHDHSVTLLDLKPGTYKLTLRSTNADGQWTDNMRTLTIVCEPTFWETPLALVLLLLLAAAVVGTAVYALLYIRRIKRQRQEALEAYLALLEQLEAQPDDAGQPASPSAPATADDPFMKSVVAFVEQNLSNADADVSQMAEHCAVSRSVLQRKMRQLVGVSPADFLREARLKHAATLLRQPGDRSVAEVAYLCGFNDPKYFSRCFRQSTGMTPTDFREQNLRRPLSPSGAKLAVLLLTLAAMLSGCEADSMYSSRPCSFVFFTNLYPTSALTRAVGSTGGDFCIVEAIVGDGGATHLALTPNRGTFAPSDLDLLMSTAITGQRINYGSMGVSRGLIIGRSLLAGLRAYDLQCPNCLEQKGGTNHKLSWKEGQPQDIECKSCGRIYNLDGEYAYVKSGERGSALIQYRNVVWQQDTGRLSVNN